MTEPSLHVPEFGRPSGEQVAWRSLCLAAVIMRGQLELDAADKPSSDETREGFERLTRFIQRERLNEWFSRNEWGHNELTFGQWTERQWINAIWRAEALATLAWALEKLEQIPPYDCVVSLHELADVIPLLRKPKHVAQFITEARLRDHDQIDLVRDVSESWHWRARTFGLANGFYGSSTDAPFDQCAPKFARTWAMKAGFEPIEDDFPAFGKAYRDVTETEWQTLSSIAHERHYGLNWLCGYSTDCDEVETHT